MKAKLLVLIIALLGMMIPGIPMVTVTSPVHAATNNLILGYYNGATTVAAKYNVSVYLNNSNVVNQDGVTPSSSTHEFVINFSQITIQAGEVTMYLSTNGYAQISSSDVQLYSLSTSLINSTSLHNVTVTASNGMPLTLTVGKKAIIGAIPLVAVPQNQYYVKAYFGTAAPVATSIAVVNVLPTISVSPASGPAGQTVTVKGYAFSAAGKVNITYTYSVRGKTYKNSQNITASSTGTFTYTFTAPELKLETPSYTSPTPPLPSGTITITALDYMSGYSSSGTYTEYGRAFYQIMEYSPVSASWVTFVPTSSSELATNGSVKQVSFYETEPMIISGIYFAPNSKVTLTFGTITLGTFQTNGSGFFNATVSVPVVGQGTYNVSASDPLAYIYFSGKPVTEIVVSTTKLSTGSTVLVNGYAFDANTYANVTWIGLCINSTGAYGEQALAVNVPVAGNGVFSTSVTVPSPTFGGIHYIYANDTKGAHSYANVTVLPTIGLSPSTASLGQMVKVSLSGLFVGDELGKMPGFTSDYFGGKALTYQLAYDNIPSYVTGINGSCYGAGSTTIAAVGYPMLHAVQLVANGNLYGTSWLNVTGTTNVVSQSAATITAINSLNSTVSKLSSTVSSDYVSLSSMLSSINASVNGVSSAVTSLSGTLTMDYSSIMSALSSISTLVSGVSSSVSSLSSSLSSLPSTISSDYNSLSSQISGLSSSLSGVSSSTSSVSSAVSSMQSTVSSLQSTVSSLTTYLLVVAVLAVIIFALEIVILVRRK